MTEYIYNTSRVETQPEQGFTGEELIRCRDCERVSCDEFGNGWCAENCREVKPWDFCSWGERLGK